jgi:dephospho-CoA kinase
VIGLVGGIGSGKSAAASILGELGAFVIDADAVGHALLNQRPVRDLVLDRFGPRVFAPETSEGSGTSVDRKALGAIVFSDPRALKDLEAILHMRMRGTFERAIARTVRRGTARAIVLDAAILFEAGWADLCDKVVFVDASRELRLARVAETRGWDQAKLEVREASQMPLDRKVEKSDVVIANAQDLDALRTSVERALEAILASAPPRSRGTSRRPTPDHAGGPPRPSSRPRGRNTGR